MLYFVAFQLRFGHAGCLQCPWVIVAFGLKARHVAPVKLRECHQRATDTGSSFEFTVIQVAGCSWHTAGPWARAADDNQLAQESGGDDERPHWHVVYFLHCRLWCRPLPDESSASGALSLAGNVCEILHLSFNLNAAGFTRQLPSSLQETTVPPQFRLAFRLLVLRPSSEHSRQPCCCSCFCQP